MILPKLRYVAISILLAVAAAFAGIWVTKPLSVARATVPSGTAVQVRLDQALASNQCRPGDQFAATLSEPVWVQGKTLIPEGARIIGKVVAAGDSGSLPGTEQLRLTLICIVMRGRSYELHTTDVAQYESGGRQSGWELTSRRFNSGAVIATPTNAAAHTVDVVAGGESHVRMPADTPLKFKLIEPLALPARG